MGTRSHGDPQGPSRIGRRASKTARKRGCHDRRCSEFKGPGQKLEAADRGRPWELGVKLVGSKWPLNWQSDGHLQTALEHTDPRSLSASGTNLSFCFTAKHCLKSPHSFMSLHIPTSRISPTLRLFLVGSPVAVLLNRPK